MDYGLKIFEEDINLDLYYQFKEMVASTVDAQTAKKILGRSIFGYFQTDRTIWESCRVNSPGEVLERYREFGFDTAGSKRALLIALTECMTALGNCIRIFEAVQLSRFIDEMRGSVTSDVYILCALLRWETDVESRLQLCSRAAASQELSDAELLYLALTSKEYDGIWDRFELSIAYMFLFHRVDVYENVGVLEKLIESYAPEMAESKKSGSRIFKIFMKMQQGCIGRESKDFKYLMDLTYTEQEIIYLNICLSRCCSTDSICSITARQNIALAGCKIFITAENIENQRVLYLLEELLARFYTLSKTVKGCRTLPNALKELEAGSEEVFRFLYTLRDKGIVAESWFNVPLLDQKWKCLQEIVGRDEYTRIFEYNLYQHFEEAEKYMQVYANATGGRYLDEIMLTATSESIDNITVLVGAGYIDAYAMIDKYIGDGYPNNSTKWYIRRLLNDGKEAFKYYKHIIDLDGLNGLHKITGQDDYICKIIGMEWQRQCKETFTVAPEEERVQMFEWACEEIYVETPEDYIQRLVSVLLSQTADLLPKNYAAAVCDGVLNATELVQRQKMQLTEKYKSAEEYRKLAEEAKERERQEKAEADERWRDYIQEYMQEADFPEAIVDAADDTECWKKSYMKAWLSILRENMAGTKFSSEQAGRLSSVLYSAADDGRLELNFKEITDIVKQLEVEDE